MNITAVAITLIICGTLIIIMYLSGKEDIKKYYITDIDIQEIKNEYENHAKSIIENLIKDGYELYNIKAYIEGMIDYIEFEKQKKGDD